MTSNEIKSVYQEDAWIALRGFTSMDSNSDCTSTDVYDDEAKSVLITASNSDDNVKYTSYYNNANGFPRIQQRHIEEVLLKFVPFFVKK